MPYSFPGNIPTTVKNLPVGAQKLFIRAFNSAFEKNDGDETRSRQAGWGAVKAKYEKHGEDWVLKEYTYGDDICTVRRLKYGLASKKWGEGPPTKEEAESYFEESEFLSFELEEVRQAFASAAGKHFMTKVLTRLIPEHKTYVEGFCGAAALLFAKEPSEKEYINDKDLEIIFAHRTIKSLSDDEIKSLSKRNWVGTPSRWDQMKRFRPVTKLDKLYKFLWVTKHSWGSGRLTRALSAPMPPSYFDNMVEVRNRLKNVTILNEDALEVIPKLDSSETFFYLDPPYNISYVEHMKLGTVEWKEFKEVLSKVKGKFLLSVANNKEMRDLFKEFSMRTVDTRRQAAGAFTPGKGYARPPIHKKELLFANYDISEFISEAKEPLTHEEQREIGEKIYGDPYMVQQKGTEKTPFVIQYHARGVWSNEERKEILSELRKADEGELKRIWKENDCAYLTKPFEDWKAELERVEKGRGDVSSIVSKYISDEMPSDIDFSKVVNRGNAHIDFRIDLLHEDYLIGWTLTSPRMAVMFLESGEVIFPLRDKILDNHEDDKIPCARKASQPRLWFNLVTKDKPEHESKRGEVGATAETGGLFFFKTKGELAFGISKDDYHEYYLWFEDKYKHLNGRWGFQKIAGRPEYTKVPAEWWMANRVYVHPKPYIIQHEREAVEEKARTEGLKKIVYSPDILKLLRSDDEGKQWLGDIPDDKLDSKYEEYSKNKASWSSDKKPED